MCQQLQNKGEKGYNGKKFICFVQLYYFFAIYAKMPTREFFFSIYP